MAPTTPAGRIAAFFVTIAVVYAILIMPWLHGREVYAAAFRAVGNTVFREVGPSGRAYFSSHGESGLRHDTTVEIRNTKAPGARGKFDVDTWNMGYLATVFLASLVLATPIPWRRRTVALATGLAMISLFVALRMYLQLVDAFSDANPLKVYELGRFWKGAVTVLIKVLSMTPVTTYIAPIFVWILATFRRGDLAGLTVRQRADWPSHPIQAEGQRLQSPDRTRRRQ